MSDNPVVEVARKQGGTSDGIHTLSTGVRVRVKPVPPALVNDVMLRVKVPQVPDVWNEKKGRAEPNPLDPGHIAALAYYDQERGAAALDAVAMFGLELVDGMPEDTTWVHKLGLLGIDVGDDPIAQEFYYKKYIALGNDLDQLQQVMGVTAEDVTNAKKS
jgi:hypothetical protein